MKNKSKGINYDYEFFDIDFVKRVLDMYLTGMPITAISMYTGNTVENINKVLDYFTPYL